MIVRRLVLVSAMGLVALGAATRVAAQTPTCDGLDGRQAALASQIIATEHPYDCCDDTIDRCLRQPRVCSLAWRLADNICRRVRDGQDEERIRRALSRRARSMLPASAPADIALDGVPAVGDCDAGVEVVLYVCARCPFCSRLVPRLHEAFSRGAMGRQACMHLKVFPIRGHPFSKEAGLAFVASAEQGEFWPYVLRAYAEFDRFSVDRLRPWAEDVGLDGEVFDRLRADPGIRDALVESKKEGLRNRVDETPTVFINGRKFMGDLTADELLDVIAEERDAVSGRTYIE